MYRRRGCSFRGGDIADSYFVMDHTTEAFPEVAAVEFLGSLFGLENNVIIIATYISCSNLDASQRYLETHHISQTMALAGFILAPRMAGYFCVATSTRTLLITQGLQRPSLNSTILFQMNVTGRSGVILLALTSDGTRTAKNSLRYVRAVSWS